MTSIICKVLDILCDLSNLAMAIQVTEQVLNMAVGFYSFYIYSSGAAVIVVPSGHMFQVWNLVWAPIAGHFQFSGGTCPTNLGTTNLGPFPKAYLRDNILNS